jgi:hypothetical protein
VPLRQDVIADSVKDGWMRFLVNVILARIREEIM